MHRLGTQVCPSFLGYVIDWDVTLGSELSSDGAPIAHEMDKWAIERVTREMRDQSDFAGVDDAV